MLSTDVIITVPVLVSDRDSRVLDFISKAYSKKPNNKLSIVRQIGKTFDIASCVNRVVSICKADLLWIVPFDLLCWNNWISEPTWAVAQPFTHIVEMDEKQTLEILKGGTLQAKSSNRRSMDFGRDSILVKRSFFNEMGGLEESFDGSGLELYEFCLRASEKTRVQILMNNCARLSSSITRKIEPEIEKALNKAYPSGVTVTTGRTHKAQNGFPKVDPSRLIPFITVDSPAADQIAFIKEYSQFLASEVYVLTERQDDIKAVWDIGKKPVPLVTTGTLYNYRRPSQDDVLAFPKPKRKYLDWVLSKSDAFTRILCGNAGPEINGGRGHMLALEGLFPSLKSKMDFGPFDELLEQEAYKFMGFEASAPLRQYFIANKRRVFSFCGFWCLYQDVFEMLSDGHYPNVEKIVNPDGFGHNVLRIHLFTKDKGRVYPYKYFSDYLKNGPDVWSGIGFNKGAKQHNLARLISAGYSGCFMYTPGVSSRARRSFAEEYLTDIEGFNE